MSNNPNFVSELVQMAKAFEELPIVQAALSESREQVTQKDITIHELEARIIDLANELDSARSATRKAEVERDHAETMFLETDDKLQKGLDVLKTFIGNANDFIRVVEPPKPEPVAEAAQPTSHEVTDQSWAAQTSPTHEVTVEEGASASPPIHQPSQNTSASPDGSTATDAPTASVSEPAPYPSWAGPVEPTNEGSPATSIDGPLNTTSPEGAGSSGNTDSPLEIGTSTANQSSADGPVEASGSTNEPPQDDVGYHNEPASGSAWMDWYDRMQAKYGTEFPARQAQA